MWCVQKATGGKPNLNQGPVQATGIGAAPGRLLSWGGGGIFVYQKWPNQIFPIVSFVFSWSVQIGSCCNSAQQSNINATALLRSLLHWPRCTVL